MRFAFLHSARRFGVAFTLICASLCAVPVAVAAPPQTVERFDANTWEQMKTQLPRPSAIVFTATYCVNCPAVMDRLTQALRERGLQPHVIAVVIDEASTEQLLTSPHYEHASSLFAFAGNEAALRYGVDPRWRGETPYVALLNAAGQIVFAAGTPSEAKIGAWLGSDQRN
ncbi:MAG: hypothetical protein LBE59_05285 [Nevskiaceae bacterium]|jgi:hypothetical protein|nr:hypothetical protein [Nevskiaceae bacterium]